MADIKIPAFPAATDPDGGEVLEVVQGGVSKKMTTAQVATLSPSEADLAAARNAAAPREGAIMLAANNASGATIAIGTSDFVLTLPALYLDDWSVSDTDAANLLWESAASGNNRVRVGLRANGVWRITFTNTSGTETTYDITPTVAFTDASAATVNLAFDRDGNATLWRNGVANGSVSIAAASAIDLGSGNANPYRFFGGTSISGILREAILHNLLLTDIADRYASGVWVPSAEQWGAPKQTFDFESGLQGAVMLNAGVSAGSVALNTSTPISGSQDLLVTITTGDSFNYPRIQIPTTYSDAYLREGNRYRLKFATKVVTGSPVISAFCWDNAGGAVGATGEPEALTLVGTQTHEYTFTQLTFRTIGSADRAKLTIFHNNLSSGSSYQIDNIEIEPLGATLALTPQGLGRQLLDVSANRNHALATTEPAYTVPKLEGVITRRQTNVSTSGVWIEASDILPADCVITGFTADGVYIPVNNTNQNRTLRRIHVANAANVLTISRTSGTTAGTALGSATVTSAAAVDLTIHYRKNP